MIGEKFYIMGGSGGEKLWYNDLHFFDTGTVVWKLFIYSNVCSPRLIFKIIVCYCLEYFPAFSPGTLTFHW